MTVWKKVSPKSVTKWKLQSLNGELQKFLRPSDRELPGDYFVLWNFWKRSFLAWVTDNQSLVPNRGTFCYVFTPICHFFWLSLFSLPLCTFFGHFLSNPPSKIHFRPFWVNLVKIISGEKKGGGVKYLVIFRKFLYLEFFYKCLTFQCRKKHFFSQGSSIMG